MSWKERISLEAFEELSSFAHASSEIREELATIRQYLDYDDLFGEDEDLELYGCSWRQGLLSEIDQLVGIIDNIYKDAEEILETIHSAQPRILAWLRSDSVARSTIRWIH